MIFRAHQLIGLLFLSIYFAIKTGKRFHPIVGILLIWVALRSIPIFENPYADFGVMMQWIKNPVYLMTHIDRLDALVGQSWIWVVMGVFFAGSIHSQTTDFILEPILGSIILFNSLLVMMNGIGFFNNLSMDSTFIAMCWPVLAFRPKSSQEEFNEPGNMLWGTLVVLVPLLAIRESTAYFVVAASVGAWALASKKWWVLILGMGAALLFGWLAEGELLLDPNGRLEYWDMFMTWWGQYGNHWIGQGVGSFEWYGPAISEYVHHKKVGYLWMHNEYLQILFEMGYIGLGIVMGLIGICMFKARKEPWLFATNTGILVAMLTQYPLRWTLSMVFVCILIRLSVNERDLKECQLQSLTSL